MRILIVRHGDPNYELDTLTETGWKEAELVAEKLSGFDIKAFYVSPLGRAQDTASCTLKRCTVPQRPVSGCGNFRAVSTDRM